MPRKAAALMPNGAPAPGGAVRPAAACPARPAAVSADAGQGQKVKLLAGFEPAQLAAWGPKGGEEGTCVQGRSMSARSGEATAGKTHARAKAN